jgi:hypothetical protein
MALNHGATTAAVDQAPTLAEPDRAHGGRHAA